MHNFVATLPPNTTPLERALATSCAALVDIPVPLRDLWSTDRCPLALLPILAWSFSVDRWDDSWSEATKRATIKASRYIHQHKGTIAAVRRVVASLGYVIKITEWWQTIPRGPRGTFGLEIGLLDSGISEEMFVEMERLIADTKPLSRHLIGLAIHLETRGTIFISALAYHGDEMTIYPWLAEKIEVRGILTQVGASQTIDTMTVYS